MAMGVPKVTVHILDGALPVLPPGEERDTVVGRSAGSNAAISATPVLEYNNLRPGFIHGALWLDDHTEWYRVW
jgi:hypothetical protein